jgi:hypothetical protein
MRRQKEEELGAVLVRLCCLNNTPRVGIDDSTGAIELLPRSRIERPPSTTARLSRTMSRVFKVRVEIASALNAHAPSPGSLPVWLQLPVFLGRDRGLDGEFCPDVLILHDLVLRADLRLPHLNEPLPAPTRVSASSLFSAKTILGTVMKAGSVDFSS